MILSYRGIKITLSCLDYKIWLEHLNPERIEVKGKNHLILPGRCPFCERFEIRRKGYEHNCTECQLKAWGVHEGNDKIDGCYNLMIDVLGNPEMDGPAIMWGLVLASDFTVVIGNKGRGSIVALRQAIQNSVVNSYDDEGVKSYFESKKEKQNIQETPFTKWLETEQSEKQRIKAEETHKET